MAAPTGPRERESFRLAPQIADDLQTMARSTNRTKTRVIEDALAAEKRRLERRKKEERK